MKNYEAKFLKSVESIEDVMLDIALYNIDGMDEEEAKDFLLNNAIPAYGAVSGLIYYKETKPIAVQFYNEIIELLKDIYGDYIPTQVIENLNNLSWSAWEVLVLGNEDFIDKILDKAKKLNILEG